MSQFERSPIRASARSRRRVRATVLVALMLLASHASAQQNPLFGTIRGRVADENTGAGIAAVLVDLLDGRTRVRASATTDAEGNFVLPRVPPGDFRLRAARIGYARTVTPYWRIAQGEVLTVTIRLDPEAVLLAPLEITARARTESPMLEGFHQRKKQGFGVFISREDIDRQKPARVTDLFRTVPGVRVETAPGSMQNSRVVKLARALPGCAGIQVFVDGVLASRGEVVSLDDLAVPHDLEGVELHHGLGTVPPEFANANARCGVIALWTRRGA